MAKLLLNFFLKGHPPPPVFFRIYRWDTTCKLLAHDERAQHPHTQTPCGAIRTSKSAFESSRSLIRGWHWSNMRFAGSLWHRHGVPSGLKLHTPPNSFISPFWALLDNPIHVLLCLSRFVQCRTQPCRTQPCRIRTQATRGTIPSEHAVTASVSQRRKAKTPHKAGSILWILSAWGTSRIHWATQCIKHRCGFVGKPQGR